MTYVGAVPTTGDFKKLDAITASATATYNLRQGGVAVYPQSSSHCLVVLNGILQTGGSSFNIVNDTIVFSEALTSNDVINQILVLGNVNDIGVPSDDTVSTAKIQADAINATKIADDSISDEHLDITAITGQTAITSLADTDKFLVSDASDSGNLKYVEKQYLGGGTHVKLLSGSASSSVNHDFQNFMDTSKYRSYLVQFTDVVSAGNNERLDLIFVANTTLQNGSNYWGAVQGYRSGDATYVDAYEQITQGKLGVGLVMNSGNAGNYLFHIINSPNQQDMSNSVYGNNWGYNSSQGDYVFTNYAFTLNNSANVTGMRITESGGNATTFDYQIYGILK